MTYEEARDEIKYLSDFLVTESEPLQNSPDWSQITIYFDSGALDTLGLAVEALEKQIPKRPTESDDVTKSNYQYPNCKAYWDCDTEYELKHLDYKCCPYCGQAIDFKEE